MKDITEILFHLIKALNPPRIYSWQVLILASLLTWILALFMKDNWQNLLLGLGWTFLMIGLAWLAIEKPLWFNGISLSSWLVGALVCIVIFGSQSTQISSIAIVVWPTISGAIAALTELVKPGPKVEIPPPNQRHKVVILILAHILISCWLQFYFLINNWLQDYPSILEDNANRNAVLLRIEPPRSFASRGIIVLNSMENRLTAELDKKPWSSVEQWVINASEKVTALEKQIMQELPDIKEDTLWIFVAEVTSSTPGYNLQLLASWRGPSSYQAGYHLKKSCQILPTQRQPIKPSGSSSQSKTIISVASPSALSQVKCGPVSQPISGQPKSA